MAITFIDKDLAEINIDMAEHALTKASLQNGKNQIKALLIAKNSINTALQNLGFDDKVEIKRGLSKKQSPKEQSNKN